MVAERKTSQQGEDGEDLEVVIMTRHMEGREEEQKEGEGEEEGQVKVAEHKVVAARKGELMGRAEILDVSTDVKGGGECLEDEVVVQEVIRQTNKFMLYPMETPSLCLKTFVTIGRKSSS